MGTGHNNVPAWHKEACQGLSCCALWTGKHGREIIFLFKKKNNIKGKEASAGGGGTSVVAYCDGSSRESGRIFWSSADGLTEVWLSDKLSARWPDGCAAFWQLLSSEASGLAAADRCPRQAGGVSFWMHPRHWTWLRDREERRSERDGENLFFYFSSPGQQKISKELPSVEKDTSIFKKKSFAVKHFLFKLHHQTQWAASERGWGGATSRMQLWPEEKVCRWWLWLSLKPTHCTVTK